MPKAVKSYNLDKACWQWLIDQGAKQDRSASWYLNDLINRCMIKQGMNKSKTAKPKVDLSEAFEIFYSAGLVKKSKKQAYSKFCTLVKQMKTDPVEFAQLLAADIKNRIAINQMGIDALHPSTYLNQQRWEDDYTETKHGQAAPASAAERVAAKNRERYGEQAGSGLGMGEDGRDLREPMGQGVGGGAAIDLDPSAWEASTE